MQFVPYRNLYKSLPAFRKKLISEGAIVLTVGNKPFAAIISIDDENVQDISFMVSGLRAQMAAFSIRNQVRKDGMDRTTLKEVNVLIKRTRTGEKRGKWVTKA